MVIVSLGGVNLPEAESYIHQGDEPEQGSGSGKGPNIEEDDDDRVDASGSGSSGNIDDGDFLFLFYCVRSFLLIRIGILMVFLCNFYNFVQNCRLPLNWQYTVFLIRNMFHSRNFALRINSRF